MNMLYCSVCGEEYNASRTGHTCRPEGLEKIFLQEQNGEGNLDSILLSWIRQEITDNGSPAHLVAMWEKSAGRSWPA